MAGKLAAQDLPPDENDAEVSYIYAAVMGTGSYKIEGRRISMLRIPLSYTQREMTQQQTGLVWSLPVVIGYDAVSDHNWLGDFLDDDLVTLSALPGFEYQIPYNPIWTLKPFGNLGLTRDFSGEETIIMGVLGIRALGTWIHPEGWEVRWGNAFQVAGEYQTDSYHRSSFGLIETGVDLRRNTSLTVAERALNAGIYYRYQYFIPEWDIAKLRRRESDIGSLHEFGVSVGLKTPIEILGFTVSRLRVGYTFGSDVEGWTFGTEFPF